MRPQSYGSSTIGVKKSSVAISPSPDGSRYTAASSPVSAATRRSAEARGNVTSPRTVRRSSGPSLHPQPAPWLKLVSRRSVVISRTAEAYEVVASRRDTVHPRVVEPPPRPDWSMPPGGPVPGRPRSGRGPVLVVAILLLAIGAVALV